MKLFLKILLISVAAIQSFSDNETAIKRMNPASVNREKYDVIPHIIEFRDTIGNDTLFEIISQEEIPISYFRNIRTGVCIEGKCRLVSIRLYWDATGRYLGFELPPGEFLSKTEHHPFTGEEYDRLHKLLSDPLSLLARYTYDQLAPKKDSLKVDATTSATIADILDHVVKGAVYTTYTLWHLVYGQAKQEAEKLTGKKMSQELFLEILDSPDAGDKVWALNHLPASMQLDSAAIEKILELVKGEDVYLAERALNSIPVRVISDEITQQKLISAFTNTGFLQKRFILNKLMEASELSAPVIEHLAMSMKDFSGMLVVQVLELFKKHRLNDPLIAAETMKLLENENRFIAGKAFQFLSGFQEKNREMETALKKYEKRK